MTAIRHSGSGTQFSHTGIEAQIAHTGSGDIYIHTGSDNQSLFDPLVLRGDRFSGQQIARIKESKASYRTARLVSNFCASKGPFG
jgi:hypothetical protein